MIFVTVGTQLPFDRLVRAVDEWAGLRGRTDVFAQMGPSEYRPRFIESRPFISPEEHRRRMEGATAVVGHAGMGTIIGALELGKPVLVMPRRAGLGEQRNDHQLATAKRFSELKRVAVAWDESELPARLDELERLVVQERVGSSASETLIGALRRFIDGEHEPAIPSRLRRFV